MDGLNVDTLPNPYDRYKLGECLGSGVFAQVYKANDKQAGGKSVAAKVRRLDADTAKSIREEYKILRDFTSHPNILDFYGIFCENISGGCRKIWFILELCEGGSVSDMVCKLLAMEKKMKEEHIAFILKETVKHRLSIFTGCAGLLVSYPLDTVKVHMQMGTKGTTISCLRDIVARDSVKGLFRGVGSPLAGVAFANAIVFGVYGATLRRFEDQKSVVSQGIAGAVSGCAQSVIACPTELAKTRMQLGMQGSTLGVMRQIVKEGGVSSLFRGFGITVLRDSPGLATYFLAYELLTRTSDGCPPSPALTFVAGGLAGAISWVVSYPLDVIKSRLQADGMSGRPVYTGMVDCLKKSVKSEGYRCLLRGFNTVMARAFITNSVCFSAVNWVYRIAENRHTGVSHNVQRRPRKQTWMYSSLVSTGAFCEAICESDIRELHEDLLSDHGFHNASVPIELTVFKETI